MAKGLQNKKKGGMGMNILKLVDEELKSANEKFPPFQSEHEGYAVLLEEVEELQEELDNIKLNIAKLWSHIRNEAVLNYDVSNILHHSENAIEEAVQVSAMCLKLRSFINGGK
jgi:hypothetical protein